MPDEGADDRVNHDQSLVGEEDQREDHIQMASNERGNGGSRSASELPWIFYSQQREERLCINGNQQQRESGDDPVPRRFGQEEPGRQQKDKQAGVDEAPPEVVEYLPT
jgi:hypothetical protein